MFLIYLFCEMCIKKNYLLLNAADWQRARWRVSILPGIAVVLIYDIILI